MSAEKFKAGYVALIGKPNVGKSTLLNFFLKENLSIISPKPQTTRDNIIGIVSGDNYQIVFVDTPGIHKPKDKLAQHMISSATSASNEADELIVIVDAAAGLSNEDYQVFNFLQAKKNLFKTTWCAVLINKMDLVKKELLLPLVDICRQKLDFINDFIPISLLRGDNLDLVFKKILEFLPLGHAFYPAEQLTDKNERYIVAELIRKQTLNFCREEIPHSIAVEVDTFKEKPGRKTLIRAIIYVERQRQKEIVIGKGGQMLKKIGSVARQEIESFLSQHVFLELWVKVHAHWRRDLAFLRRLGYSQI